MCERPARMVRRLNTIGAKHELNSNRVLDYNMFSSFYGMVY